MYKVSIPVLKRALKNQQVELTYVQSLGYSSPTTRRRESRLEKSIKELKFILGEE